MIDMVHPGIYGIEIYTLTGQRTCISELHGSSCQIDLSFYPKGIYLIVIRSEDFLGTGKIIKL